jgi:rhodanese-related sulfurtransferase
VTHPKAWRIFSIFSAILFATAVSSFAQSIGWSLVNSKIRQEFPDVPRISTNELAARLSNGKERPVLLDVRTKAEFEVSHLSGAQRVEPGADPKTISIPKDKAVITYCSVGYRSAVFANKLRGAGYRHVENLEGSIFRWANENRPLVHDGGAATDKVHPYNGVWGMLLDKSHRAPNPLAAVPERKP